MEFDIPIGKNGDCYDRYCIRMEEMRQSVRIMKQCIAKLRAPEGQGPVAIEDNKIRIKFKHAAGLKFDPSKPGEHFTIAGEDMRFVPAKAEIDGETVVVSSSDVAKPAAVRFGWSDTSEPNLFNGAGLPASPFRTDSFPMVTAGKR